MNHTKRKFVSASGISDNARVIVTITKLENPSWATVGGSVGDDPFVFGAGVQYSAVQKAYDTLYERHPTSRDEISDAIADALANFTAILT